MFFPIAILLSLGAASVMQGGFNRQLIGSLGLAKVVLLNNSVLLIASLAFFVLRSVGSFAEPASGIASNSFSALRLNQLFFLLLPGVLGLTLVAGIPWAISKWGASFVFIGLIGSQVFFSLVWDFAFESVPFDARRVVSFVLGVASVLFMMGAKK